MVNLIAVMAVLLMSWC